MLEIHKSKSHDYATQTNPYQNFEETAFLVNMFRGAQSIDQVFVALIAVKLSRLGNLMSSGKSPENESVKDSLIDLANYAAIWASYYEG